MFMQPGQTFADARAVFPAAFGTMPLASGLVAGTLLETARGWVPAERLVEGMAVQTYEGGTRRIAQVARRAPHPELWQGPGAGLVEVPGGALDNCADLRLLPDQPVLVHADAAEAVLGSSAVLVPAAALVGHRGIRRVHPLERTELTAVSFAEDEIVFGNTGALLFCPSTVRGPGAAPEPGTLAGGFFPMLDEAQAAALMALIGDGALSSGDLALAA